MQPVDQRLWKTKEPVEPCVYHGFDLFGCAGRAVHRHGDHGFVLLIYLAFNQCLCSYVRT